MNDILARVRALLARAASPAEEEARTCAHIAARLIREHGIELSLPRSSAAPPTAWPAAPPRGADAVPRRRTISARFAGYCRLCGAHYRVGELVSWARGLGAVHVPCAARERAA